MNTGKRRVHALLASCLLFIALCAAAVAPAQHGATQALTPVATVTTTAPALALPYSFARFNVDLFFVPPHVRLFVRLCISIDRKC